MALSSQHELGIRTARERMAEILQENGTEPDYSLASLEGLERVLGRHRRQLAEDPAALTPDALALLQVRAGSYLAEVVLRAVPGTDLSLTAGGLVVNVPAGLVPNLTFRLYPVVRVAELLREEDGELTLVAWVAFAAVMASPGPSTSPGPTDPAVGDGGETGQLGIDAAGNAQERGRNDGRL